MRSLIGGLDSLCKRIQYPSEALANKMEGKVYVLALIDTTGVSECSKIIKGIGYGCDEEALRLVDNAKLIPASHRGKPLKVAVAIPVLSN